MYVLANILQIIMKIQDKNGTLMPETNNPEKYEIVDKIVISVNILVMITSSIKLLIVLRTFEAFGKLIAFLFACIQDITAFLTFLILILMMIASLYKLIGVDYIFM